MTAITVWFNHLMGRRNLSDDQCRHVNGVYILAWVLTPALGMFLGRCAMVVHLFLPWIAVGLALFYRKDFTFAWPRFEEFENVTVERPMSLVYGWIIGPLYFALTRFAEFLGSPTQFVMPGLWVAGALLLAIVISAIVSGIQMKPGAAIRFAPALLFSLLYGYQAVTEVDVLFDRSPEVVYGATVISKNRGYGTSGLYLSPWGPVTVTKTVEVPNRVHRQVKKGGAVCMVLRSGALGVPWYSAQACPWTGGATDIGP